MNKAKLTLLAVFLIIIVPVYGQDSEEFVSTKIAKGLQVDLPKSFRPMSEGEMAQQYVSYRKPMAMYTSPQREADFGVNMSMTEFRPSDMNIMREFYKASILNLYSEVQMLDSGITSINGNEYVFFEFISTVKPDENSVVNNTSVRQYTYIQYTVFNGKTFVINFNCRSRYYKDWQEKAQRIMQSIRFKKTNKG